MTFDPAPNRGKSTMVEIMKDKGYPVSEPVVMARNTLSCCVGDCRFILYHNTIILRFSERGDTFTLDTGGFNTATTSDRLNRFMGNGWRVSLSQSKGKMPVIYRGDAHLGKRFCRYAAVASAGLIISDLD